MPNEMKKERVVIYAFTKRAGVFEDKLSKHVKYSFWVCSAQSTTLVCDGAASRLYYTGTKQKTALLMRSMV